MGNKLSTVKTTRRPRSKPRKLALPKVKQHRRVVATKPRRARKSTVPTSVRVKRMLGMKPKKKKGPLATARRKLRV
ncbi:hypothetical protein K7432_016457 [Basidiobolus ranarum]|uniref:Uncharacterized protein n=1 Tax=Basidiobolus ranarum TaxID=34480 RepID=A0ABR2WET1_9FUNG